MRMGKLSHGFLNTVVKKASAFFAHFLMDDNALNPVVSDSANGLDGTFTDPGGNPNTSDHTTLLDGESALSFDGIDDYIMLGEEEYNFASLYEETSVSGDMDSHQGVCYDANNVYTIHTDKIYKRNLTSPYAEISSVTLATVLSEMSSSFNNTPNHFGDACQYGDYLYVPLEYWNGCGDHTDHYIVKIRKSDFAVMDEFNLDAQGHETAGVGTDGSYLYVVSYCDGSKVWRYDLDGTYVDNIVLSKTISNIQGIAINTKHNEMYISGDTDDYIFAFDMSGNLLCRVYKATSDVALEGLDTSDDEIIVMVDSGTDEIIHFLQRPVAFSKGVTLQCIASTTNVGASAEQALIARYEYDASKRQYDLGFHNNGKLDIRFFETGFSEGGNYADAFSADGTISADTPYKCLAVWDAYDEKVRIYIDGTMHKEVDYPYGLKGHDQKTVIGRLIDTPVTAFLSGKVRDAKLWKIGLRPTQVRDEYGETESWKLNDNAPNTNVIPALGGHSGTIIGGKNSEDMSVITPHGRALQFDGSVDYINFQTDTCDQRENISLESVVYLDETSYPMSVPRNIWVKGFNVIWRFRIDPDGTPRLLLGVSSSVFSSYTLPLRTYVKLSLVINTTTGNTYLFADDKQVGSAVIPASPLSSATGYSFQLSSTTSEKWKGTIQLVKFYPFAWR